MDRIYQENDVVRWSFSELGRKKYKSDQIYWCKSRVAIFNSRGKFLDTYWSYGDKFTFHAEDPYIDLVYLGNLDDYKPCGRDAKRYYDPKDIMDISHANDSSAIYIRKDAKKNAAIMFETISRELFALESELVYLNSKKERLRLLKTDLQTTKNIEGIYI